MTAEMMKRLGKTMSPADYLKKPYGRLVVPDTGGFRAEIVEFPGCIAIGNTASEALANLEEVAVLWIEGALEKRQPIPLPLDSGEGFSGKLVLRLPRSLHKRATHQAGRDGVSLNQFIVACVAERMGELASEDTTASVTYVPVPVAQNIAVVGTGGSAGQLLHGVAAIGSPLWPQFTTGTASMGVSQHFTGIGQVQPPNPLRDVSEAKNARS
jgi:predicted RNase H-like HicB family nuclease